ncbi:uncharacterized protein N7482_006576 [Penicillium canariense]|uniref:Alpha/beta hydrolase fold-3 domain-containing protein n=1 Tax=Penicillium canariense TaxID=189055 RepID=A0A9W9LIA5_9EURO|nr:uncharacterized protein N7482_006576 [Penicillium canariense]KAJ5159572.1 hypothetical protein N7482_006576 [Penicillium canariense]
MADFSEYTGPSEDWLALEPTLPPMPSLPLLELRQMINKGREELAAQGMINLVQFAGNKTLQLSMAQTDSFLGTASQVEIQDYTITTRDGATIEARTYRLAGIPASQRLPVYIHLHGGGFLFGTLSSEDAICSRILVSRVNNGTPVVVFNVNYRHTPEHPFPTAWNDVEDAFVWLHGHMAEIGGQSDQVVVGGISAGATLTASLALAQLYGDNEKLKACPKIRGQVLMIPCLVILDYYAPRKEWLRSAEISSLVTCAEAPILPISRINLFMSLLKVNNFPDAGRNLRMNPGNATAEEVKNLPPTTFGIAVKMGTSGPDGLIKLFADNDATRVPTNVTVFRGVPHGFRRYGDKLTASKRWDEVMSGGITWALSNPAAGSFEIKAD